MIVAVLFGSRSVEHDVSVVTALQLMDHVQGHEVLPVYVGREGGMYTGPGLRNVKAYQPFVAADHTPVTLEPFSHAFRAVQPARKLFSASYQAFPFDVVIPAFHGLNGEDGTIQGLLELCNVPYTSAGMLGSAACMDKGLMKEAIRGAGFPVLPCEVIGRDRWDEEPEAVLTLLEERLGYPLFVKPANLGSSIGISKATDRDGLRSALDVAVHYDRRIVIEKGLEQVMEINCAGLGYGDDVQASVCEEPLSWQQFLTFDAKYLAGSGKTGGKTGGKNANAAEASGSMANMGRIIPAGISDEETQQVQRMTVDLFKLFDLKGVVRVDYLRDQATGKLYVNEINTIPGSFAFYLWEPMGIAYPQLIERMLGYAKAAHAQKNRNQYAFDSSLLQSYGGGVKGTKGQK